MFLSYLLRLSRPKQCQLWVPSHGVGLSRIRHWLVNLTRFVPPLLYHILQSRQISAQIFCGWVDVYFPFAWLQHSFPVIDLDQGVKVYVGTSSTSPCFVSCVYCLQHWDLAVSVWRATYCHDNSLHCLGISMRSFWLTTELDGIQSQHLHVHLVMRYGRQCFHLL